MNDGYMDAAAVPVPDAGGTTLRIELTQGYFALVDVADYPAVSKFKWHVHFGGNSGPYAGRKARRPGGWSTQLMHRYLIPDADLIDHRNGNGLDNRRANLRKTTTAKNGQNRTSLTAGNNSGYRGVSRMSGACNRWRACIHVDGRTKHLGLFVTAEEAARAFDAAAIQHFGDYAGYLNFPLVEVD